MGSLKLRSSQSAAVTVVSSIRIRTLLSLLANQVGTPHLAAAVRGAADVR